MKLFIFTFFLFSFAISKKPEQQDYIKNYYPHIYVAEEYFLAKKYADAVTNYEKAFENCEPLRQHLVICANAYFHLKDNKKGIFYLRKSILKGATLSKIKEYLPTSKSIIKSNEWSELENEYDYLRTQHILSLNLNLKKTIDSLRIEDQRYRNGVLEDMRKNWSKQSSIDGRNLKLLVKLIEQYGWLSENVIGIPDNWEVYNIKEGDTVYSYPFNILMHIPDDDINLIQKIKDMMFTSIRKGLCPPSHLGMFTDYKLLNNRVYGYGYDKVVESLKHFHKIDSLRSSVGLENFKFFLQKKQLRYKNIKQ